MESKKSNQNQFFAQKVNQKLITNFVSIETSAEIMFKDKRKTLFIIKSKEKCLIQLIIDALIYQWI